MEYCQAYGCEYATGSPHQLCVRHFAMLPLDVQQHLAAEYAVKRGNSTPYLVARMKSIRWLNERLQKGDTDGR